MKKATGFLAIAIILCFIAGAAIAGQMMTGSVTGTGSSINVSCGFIPDAVQVTNITNGTAKTMWWNKAMGNGKAVFVNGTAGPKVAASNGITPYAGSYTAAKGFTIGTSANQVNTSGDTLTWVAYQ